MISIIAGLMIIIGVGVGMYYSPTFRKIIDTLLTCILYTVAFICLMFAMASLEEKNNLMRPCERLCNMHVFNTMRYIQCMNRCGIF